MKDLRDAIKQLVKNADTTIDNSKYIVNEEDLYNLVSEYNIHFVEPDQEQLTL